MSGSRQDTLTRAYLYEGSVHAQACIDHEEDGHICVQCSIRSMHTSGSMHTRVKHSGMRAYPVQS